MKPAFLSRKVSRSRIKKDTWITSYADLITQLLVFFIVILSASQINMKKMEEVQKSIKGETSNHEDLMKKLLEHLKQSLQNHGLVESVTIQPEENGISMIIKDSLLFGSGEALIAADKLARFSPVLETLKEVPEKYHFTIEGHTDDVPVAGGPFASNWELASSRGISVLNFFIHEGFSEKRLSVHSYSDQRPMVPNRSPSGEGIPENRAKNRRVVIHVN